MILDTLELLRAEYVRTGDARIPAAAQQLLFAEINALRGHEAALELVEEKAWEPGATVRATHLEAQAHLRSCRRQIERMTAEAIAAGKWGKE